jgi:hypothetical protein
MAAEHPFGGVDATANDPLGLALQKRCADGCRPPVALRPGRWWSLPGGAGCTCRPSIWQLPSSRWKAIRAALERAVKRATAAAATARDGEAAANAVAPPPLAGAELLLGWEWGTSGGQ